MILDEKTYGQIAFEAYCENRKNTTYDDKPIPSWDELKPDIKEAWGIATVKAISQFCTDQKLNERLAQ